MSFLFHVHKIIQHGVNLSEFRRKELKKIIINIFIMKKLQEFLAFVGQLKCIFTILVAPDVSIDVKYNILCTLV